jgi:hypothetical protein
VSKESESRDIIIGILLILTYWPKDQFFGNSGNTIADVVGRWVDAMGTGGLRCVREPALDVWIIVVAELDLSASGTGFVSLSLEALLLVSVYRSKSCNLTLGPYSLRDGNPGWEGSSIVTFNGFNSENKGWVCFLFIYLFILSSVSFRFSMLEFLKMGRYDGSGKFNSGNIYM